MKYIRQIAHKPRWAEQLPAGDGQAFQKACAEWCDPDFLSVYTATTEANELLVAFAISAGRSTPRSFNYIRIDPQDVAALSLPILENPGATIVDSVNAWHRDIDLQGDAAPLLNRVLKRGMEVRSFSKSSLKTHVKGELATLAQSLLPDMHWLRR